MKFFILLVYAIMAGIFSLGLHTYLSGWGIRERGKIKLSRILGYISLEVLLALILEPRWGGAYSAKALLVGIAALIIPFLDVLLAIIFQKDTKESHEVSVKKIIRMCALGAALFVAGLFWTRGGVTISLDIDSIGDYVQVFYDTGGGYSEASSSRCLNEDGRVNIKLPVRTIHINRLRLDPAESEGTFYMTGLRVSALGIPLAEYGADEFFPLLINANMPSLSLNPQGVRFDTLGNDPVCIFAESFTTFCNRCIAALGIISLFLAVLMAQAVSVFLGKPAFSKYWDKAVIKRQPGKASLYRSASVCAAAHFLICFAFQHSYFFFDNIYMNRILICQLLFFILLQVLWQVLFRIVQNVVERDQATLDFLKYAGIYLGIMLAVLLLVWPGYFVSDEFNMLFSSRYWVISSAYHFLMMLELALSQMLIPGAVGVELVQITYISAVVGYVFQQIAKRTSQSKWIYLLYVPMCFPAILLNNLQLQKGIPGTYLEILLLCKMICAFWDRRELAWRDVAEWVVLTAVVYSHRMDGCYYIIAAPVLFFLLFHKRMDKKLSVSLVVGTFLCCMAVQGIQNSGGTGTFYTLVNFNRLLYAPVMAADPVKDAAELEALGQVIDIDTYRAAKNLDEAAAAVSSSVNNFHVIKQEELSAYKKGAMKLILKHPVAFAHQQIERYLLSSGLAAYLEKYVVYSGNLANYQNPASSMYTLEQQESWHVTDFRETGLNTPVNETWRDKILLFMIGRDINNYEIYSVRNILFNNLIPCTLFLVALWGWLLKNKKYGLLGILTLFLLRLPILVGSASYVSFQYYFRFFIVGNAIPFFFVYRYLTSRDNRKGSRVLESRS